jgi:hypothetical protein
MTSCGSSISKCSSVEVQSFVKRYILISIPDNLTRKHTIFLTALILNRIAMHPRRADGHDNVLLRNNKLSLKMVANVSIRLFLEKLWLQM